MIQDTDNMMILDTDKEFFPSSSRLYAKRGGAYLEKIPYDWMLSIGISNHANNYEFESKRCKLYGGTQVLRFDTTGICLI